MLEVTKRHGISLIKLDLSGSADYVFLCRRSVEVSKSLRTTEEMQIDKQLRSKSPDLSCIQ